MADVNTFAPDERARLGDGELIETGPVGSFKCAQHSVI